MEGMLEHFGGLVHELRTSFDLRYAGGGTREEQREVLGALEGLEASIACLEGEVASCHGILQAEYEQIEAADRVRGIAEGQNERIRFALQHLPARLPNTAEPHPSKAAATTSAAAAAAAQGPAEGQENGVPAPSGKGGKGRKKAGRKRRQAPVPTLAYVRVDEFREVPAYVRNRLKRERVNQCIDGIHAALQAKYSILRTPRSALGQQLMEQFKEFKNAECRETDGRFFFLDRDLKALGGFKLDSGGRACLAVLRYLGVVQELRSGGYIRYILL